MFKPDKLSLMTEKLLNKVYVKHKLKQTKTQPESQDLSVINSFLAFGNFCRLLLTFANSLDSDQNQQNVCPDLEPNYLAL